MNYKDYLSITPEIQEAIKEGKPIVALESTILSHGMPYPENIEFAHKVEEVVRGEGKSVSMPRNLSSCAEPKTSPRLQEEMLQYI